MTTDEHSQLIPHLAAAHHLKLNRTVDVAAHAVARHSEAALPAYLDSHPTSHH